MSVASARNECMAFIGNMCTGHLYPPISCGHDTCVHRHRHGVIMNALHAQNANEHFASLYCFNSGGT